MPYHLVGPAEVAHMLGITRQRVHQLATGEQSSANLPFPPPEAVLETGRVWERKAIEDWARASGRDIRPE